MATRSTETRERIVRTAADLLVRDGAKAVSTRAVSAAAGVQAPAIYRQFGDMRELLRAASREVLARFVKQKHTREHIDDPVEALRRGWDIQIAFGLANPEVYMLIQNDMMAGDEGPEYREGNAILAALVARIAEAGRLQTTVARAMQLIHAGVAGSMVSLLSTPSEQRDLRLATAMRDMVLATIIGAPTSDVPAGAARVAARAVALRAVLEDGREILSSNERQLLGEWLDRLARVAKPARHGG